MVQCFYVMWCGRHPKHEVEHKVLIDIQHVKLGKKQKNKKEEKAGSCPCFLTLAPQDLHCGNHQPYPYPKANQAAGYRNLDEFIVRLIHADIGKINVTICVCQRT